VDRVGSKSVTSFYNSLLTIASGSVDLMYTHLVPEPPDFAAMDFNQDGFLLAIDSVSLHGHGERRHEYHQHDYQPHYL
jgi:hypothetical protein